MILHVVWCVFRREFTIMHRSAFLISRNYEKVRVSSLPQKHGECKVEKLSRQSCVWHQITRNMSLLCPMIYDVLAWVMLVK